MQLCNNLVKQPNLLLEWLHSEQEERVCGDFIDWISGTCCEKTRYLDICFSAGTSSLQELRK